MLVGVLEALFLLPDLAVELAADVGADVADALGGAGALAALHDLGLQLPEGAVPEEALLPGALRVDDDDALLHVRVGDAVLTGDEVREGVALGVVDAVDPLQAGIGDLLHRLGDLDAGLPFALPVGDGAQLVDRAEYRVGFRGDHPLAHAEGIDPAALIQYGGDGVLVQAVADHDLRAAIARLVQHAPGLPGEVGQVAGIQPDAVIAGLDAPGLHLVKDPDGVGHAGLQHIVGVHQQYAVVRVDLGELAEGGQLVLIVHHPAVGHGAAHGDVELLPGGDGGGAGDPADVAGPRAQHGGVVVVGPAGAEVGDGPALGGTDDAVGLRGDQGLVVHLGQQLGFDHLRLHQVGHHGDDRLVGIHHRALREGVDVAGEAEFAQIVEKLLLEQLQAPQVGDVLRVEAHALQVLQYLLKAGEDGEAALVRVAAVEHVEGHPMALLLLGEIAVGHGQLVQVHHHADVAAVEYGLGGHG